MCFASVCDAHASGFGIYFLDGREFTDSDVGRGVFLVHGGNFSAVEGCD